MSADIAPINDRNDPNDIGPSATVNMLSKGLLEIYQPPLEKVKLSLHELLLKQKRICDNLSVQNAVLIQRNVSDVGQMMECAKIYKDKLIAMKRQMINIHSRTQTLKKRALRVQACKEKAVASITQKRMQEEALIGKASSE